MTQQELINEFVNALRGRNLTPEQVEQLRAAVNVADRQQVHDARFIENFERETGTQVPDGAVGVAPTFDFWGDERITYSVVEETFYDATGKPRGGRTYRLEAPRRGRLIDSAHPDDRIPMPADWVGIGVTRDGHGGVDTPLESQD